MGNINKYLQNQIDTFFKQEKKTTQDLLHQISLLMFKLNSDDNDLYELYKNERIDNDTLTELVNYYDGGTVTFPTKKEYKNNLLLIMIYYLKILKQQSWDQVKKQLKLSETELANSTTISIGRQLMELNVKIKEEFKDMVKKLDDKDMLKSFVNTFKGISDE